MQAVRIHQFGGPDVLQVEELPMPEAGAGEIRIQVMAAGVNPIDWKIRNGFGGAPLPLTMGLDVAGVVDQAGAGVELFQRGDRVFGEAMPENGGYAEYTLAKASTMALLPKSLDFVQAAAIPIAGITAWQALFDVGGVQAGQQVLIHGAAGGVGSFAVQFAKWKGATVFGTASGNHLGFVKSLGADIVIDYKTQRFEDVAHGMDVVFDTIGGETLERSWKALKPGGILVSIVQPIPEGAAQAHGVRAQFFRGDVNGKELTEIAHLVDEGRVKVHVTKVLPLAEARNAQEMSESGHAHGKIVLSVGEKRETMGKAA